MPQPIQYDVGSEDALATYGLEKVAWAALASLAARGLAAGRTALPAIKAVGGKAVGAVSKPIQAAGAKLAPYATKAENAIVSGAGKAFGERGQQVAQAVVPGMGKAMATNALGQGALTGVVEGGISAYTAEPGDRMAAFGKGLAHGAATGAVGGVITGGAGHAIQGVAGAGLNHIAASKNVANPAAAVQATRDAGFMKNMGHLARGDGALGRAGAATQLAGQMGDMVGANMLLPMYLPSWAGGMGGGDSQPMQRTASAKSEADKPAAAKPSDDELYNYLMAPGRIPMGVGSAIGGAGTGIALDVLEAKGHLPRGTLKSILLNRLLPVAGTIGGGTAGYYAGSAYRDLSGNPL